MNHLLRFSVGAVAAAFCCGSGFVAPVAARTVTATVTRTAYGVAHVSAADWAGLGFGTGYAFAEDNVCLLADHLVTLAGERSRYFGAEAKVTVAFRELRNLDSDTYFRGTFDDATLAHAVQSASPEYRNLLKGYLTGYNHYLKQKGAAKLPQACRNAPWVRPMTWQDVLRLNEDKMRLGGAEGFAGAIVAAKPPGRTDSADAAPSAAVPATAESRVQFGSNGWAFGSATTGGPGILLANPHFPWTTTNRFWQVHQTIPGQLDVMGVTLSGLPSVVIGFNRDIAWTHTVSTDRHFTFFELTLDPKDPMAYEVDGHWERLQPRTVTVPVRDGAPVERTVYHSRYGPVVSVPSMGLSWTAQHVYAVKDAEESNFRAPDAWLSIERADSVDAIRRAISRPVAIPWVNTIAADRAGRVLYADVTPTPALTAAKLHRCAAGAANAAIEPLRLYVLRGEDSSCDWSADPAAATPGLFTASEMPVLLRRDFVANSNDSFWLANDSAPQSGFASIIGRSDEPQSLRTRQGLLTIHRTISEHPLDAGGVTPAAIKESIFRNDSLAAALTLDAVASLCATSTQAQDREGRDVDLGDACRVLARWDRRMDTDSRGAALFTEFFLPLSQFPGGLPAVTEPFDPADPAQTPRGLDLAPEHAQRIRVALADAVSLLKRRGVALDAPWGTLQQAPRGEERVPIHGGSGMLGVMNMQESIWQDGNGYVPVHGSSYMQVVSFDAAGPVADAVLSYSQSTDPASEHYADQTRLYSAKGWSRLPFTAAEIRAEHRSVKHLRATLPDR